MHEALLPSRTFATAGILYRYLDLRWMNSLSGLNSSRAKRERLSKVIRRRTHILCAALEFLEQFCVIYPIMTNATGLLNLTPSPSPHLRHLTSHIYN